MTADFTTATVTCDVCGEIDHFDALEGSRESCRRAAFASLSSKYRHQDAHPTHDVRLRAS